MFYKNLKVYQLTGIIETRPEQLQDLLEEHKFRECGSMELATIGFTPIFHGGSELAHHANGNITFTLAKNEKVLPARVINQELEKKVNQIEAETGSPVGKKAQQDLKQEIVHKLLPNAVKVTSYMRGSYLKASNMLVVDSATDANAEMFLAMLRKALGSLPVLPWVRSSYAASLTDWLHNLPPCGIEILETAELAHTDSNDGVAKFKNKDLQSDEVQAHLDSGMIVKKLHIRFDETFSCILSEDMSLKSIKFADVIREQNDDIPRDQVLAKIDADLCLSLGELERFIAFMNEHVVTDLEEAA